MDNIEALHRATIEAKIKLKKAQLAKLRRTSILAAGLTVFLATGALRWFWKWHPPQKQYHGTFWGGEPGKDVGLSNVPAPIYVEKKVYTLAERPEPNTNMHSFVLAPHCFLLLSNDSGHAVTGAMVWHETEWTR